MATDDASAANTAGVTMSTLLSPDRVTGIGAMAAGLGHITYDGVRLQLDVRDNQGRTALMRAVRIGDWLCAQALLRAGANARLVDNKGASLLHHVATVDSDASARMAALLIENNADVGARDIDGKLAIHVAAVSVYNTHVLPVLLDEYAAQGFDVREERELYTWIPQTPKGCERRVCIEQALDDAHERHKRKGK